MSYILIEESELSIKYKGEYETFDGTAYRGEFKTIQECKQEVIDHLEEVSECLGKDIYELQHLDFLDIDEDSLQEGDREKLVEYQSSSKDTKQKITYYIVKKN